MADFSFIQDINEQNLTEILQQSLEKPLVVNFYAPSHKESADFLALLERVAEQYQGQFILGKVNCEKEQMIAAQFRIQALPTTYLFKEAQALDAFPGALDQTSLIQRLSVILPKEEDLKFQQALDFLQVENYDAALPLLKEAWELSDKKIKFRCKIAIAVGKVYRRRLNYSFKLPTHRKSSNFKRIMRKIQALK